MSRTRIRPLLLVLMVFFFRNSAEAQLQVTEINNATLLAQKLVGDGVIVTNATMTNTSGTIPTGFFVNLGGNNIGIDSGIVMTTGRAKTDRSFPNRNGIDAAESSLADNNLGLGGDPTLAAALGAPLSDFRDAIVLEFDFVSLGDSIRFNYVLSSEEYDPQFVCQFNDAFGFFISGPGITGSQNIALIPGTALPVTILNVNNVTSASPSCVSFPQFYVSNIGSTSFSHEGHTVIFTALSEVRPCETYHLKLVIADRIDNAWDSGVFLQARSLTSNAIDLINYTQVDPGGTSYLVEGCVTGSFEIGRPRKEPNPLSVTLSYAGTATSGIDYVPLPVIVTIPANDSITTINVVPIVDALPEGVEFIKIYALAGCAAGTPTDSTIIQIRDYDTLSVSPGSGAVCKNASIQLQASGSYASYQWDPDPTLSSLVVQNPIATPVNSLTTYYVTGTQGTCNARDSIKLQFKQLEFLSKTDVNCSGSTDGQIKVSGGGEWLQPVQFSLDGTNWQGDSTFNNLSAGNYWVKIRDGNCIDSLPVTIAQAFPDILVTNLLTTAASCSGDPDGTATITVTGGSGAYSYSVDGINFQASSILNLPGGTHTITIKDGNGCLQTTTVVIPLNNDVQVEASDETSICSGRSYLIPASSNASSVSWTPALTLDDENILQPTATPTTDTWYYLTGTTGICSKTDSILIRIFPSPLANAGDDIAICYGREIQLNGSGGVRYEWSPTTNFLTPGDIAIPTVKARESLSYFLTVWDSRGCESLVPDEVVLDVTPAVKIFAGRDTVAVINQPIQLTVIELGSAGVTSYSWSPSFFLDDPNSDKPIATLPQEQRYLVTGTTPEGCEAMDDVLIKVYKGPEIYIPSAFTPNNDGRNDILHAIPVGIREFRFLRIYNRWGQVVFTTTDPAKGWDGRLNGVELPTGVYIWVAEGIDTKDQLVTRKGTITIIR